MSVPNRYIALDLELEQPNDGDRITDSRVSEEIIIEVGWVVFDSMPWKLIDEKSFCVDIGMPLSSFIKKLTGITDNEISVGTSLRRIHEHLVSDMEGYDTSRIVRQWGGGDMEAFRREVGLSHKEWKFGRSGFNVKHFFQEYATMAGLSRSGGLSKCVSRLGLKWMGRGKHRADVDALNTARLYSHIFTELYNAVNNDNGCNKIISFRT